MNILRLNTLALLVSSMCCASSYASDHINTRAMQPKIATINPINPNLDPTPYLLPKNHRLKPILDKIFAKPSVVDTPRNFIAAGFSTLYIRPKGSLRVARHPAANGYLFKLYLTSETNAQKAVWQNSLVQRCVGAAAIQKLIKEQKLRHITVPEKWLYELPATAKSVDKTYVVVTQDMNLVSRKQTKKSWKRASPSLLRELHALLKSGNSSMALVQNIPFTKNGTCSCIDTEFAPRKFHLKRVKKFFSPKVHKYWDTLQ